MGASTEYAWAQHMLSTIAEGKRTPTCTVQQVTPAAAAAAERVRVQIVHACKSTKAVTNACTHAAYTKVMILAAACCMQPLPWPRKNTRSLTQESQV